MAEELHVMESPWVRTSSATPHYRLDSAVGWMNSQTAGFCQDYQGHKEFHQPRSGVLTRFCFTLGVCLLAILSVSIFLFTQESTSRTVRYWGASYALEHFTPYLSRLNASLDPSYKTHTASTLCSCSNTAFTWISYVDFFTIYYNAPQNPIRTSAVTNGSYFCMKMVRSYPLNTSSISRVGLPQPNGSANLEEALNECIFLMSNETIWNATKPFEWLRSIYEAFKAMLQLYGSNSHASDLAFWNTANETVASSSAQVRLVEATSSLNYKLAVGMQVNWTKYVEDCSPIYCDVVKGTSFGSKFFAALAQTGGFGALMLIVTRKIVWPSIRFFSGWET